LEPPEKVAQTGVLIRWTASLMRLWKRRAGLNTATGFAAWAGAAAFAGGAATAAID